MTVVCGNRDADLRLLHNSVMVVSRLNVVPSRSGGRCRSILIWFHDATVVFVVVMCVMMFIM